MAFQECLRVQKFMKSGSLKLAPSYTRLRLLDHSPEVYRACQAYKRSHQLHSKAFSWAIESHKHPASISLRTAATIHGLSTKATISDMYVPNQSRAYATDIDKQQPLSISKADDHVGEQENGDIMAGTADLLRKQNLERISRYLESKPIELSQAIPDDYEESDSTREFREALLQEEMLESQKTMKKTLPILSGDPLSVENVVQILQESAATDIAVIDVTMKASFTDFLIITSAKSTRHMNALAAGVVKKMNEAKIKLDGRDPVVEGRDVCDDWLVVDGSNWVLHVMLPETRKEVDLESLWASDYDPQSPPDSL
eukprot:CAMPEP_0184702692 /NCGR_PEP_ID=MMETSP0313-20130426/25162_1 /TAXON_ID=2792 /ORGANISM="Porphyridium aerugineum, Strain SAG 1380-2" /LENGTH=312 /DNA_ID=CAMNT_0027163247 /DNA_START=28 /DNA_END=966 /DNA_ORIENTATION=-